MHATSEQPGRRTTFLDWLARLRLSPGILVPVAVLAAYHLVWLISHKPYNVASAVAIGASGVLALTILVLSRAAGVDRSAGVRAFLGLLGAGAIVLGGILMLRMDALGQATATSVVAALAFVGGWFIVFAAGYLRQDGDQSPQAPSFVSEETYGLTAGADALLRKFRDFGTRTTDRIVSICASELSLDDLHHVAYYLDGGCRFSIDVMNHPEMTDRFGDVDPDIRRKQYLRHGLKLNRLMVGLNREFKGIDSGILLRVVLDVERGALYYFYVDERRFLIGVTLDQDKVHKADRKMVMLVDEIRFALGHRKIEDLIR